MTPPVPSRAPEICGFDPTRLRAAGDLVAGAVERGEIPGATLWVGRRGALALHQVEGFASLRPLRRPLEPDTVFDLASLTKCVATTTALARLFEDGRLGLDDPVARYLPPFARAPQEARRQATVRHLLTHTAGLPAGGAYRGKTVTLAQVVEEIAASRYLAAPGERFLYSDFSAIALGAVVEAIARCPLDRFCRAQIFDPLGMADTRFRPGPFLAPRCASTAAGEDTSRNRGRVHDPTAAALQRAGEVAGHAGLFSTAGDLARFSQMLLNGGEYAGVRLLRPETVALFTRPQAFGRALGWDVASAYALRGELSADSFGHTGFTGTSLWIDPRVDVFVLLLSNAVHTRPPGPSVTPLRRAVSTAVARALTP